MVFSINVRNCISKSHVKKVIFKLVVSEKHWYLNLKQKYSMQIKKSKLRN